MKLVIAQEAKPYTMELCYSDNKLWVTNSTDGLDAYVAEHLGGWAPENILRLVDWAPILGYTISSDIANTIIDEFGTRFWSLCANRQLKVDAPTSPNLVRDIAQYARAMDRFPIFVFEPDLSGRLLTEFNKFFPGQIHTIETKRDIDYTAKVIYTNKIPRQPVDRIPLLVSSAGMLHGGDRQIWIQTAEKIGFKHKQTIKMMLNTRPGVGNDKVAGREKWEGVYVFVP